MAEDSKVILQTTSVAGWWDLRQTIFFNLIVSSRTRKPSSLVVLLRYRMWVTVPPRARSPSSVFHLDFWWMRSKCRYFTLLRRLIGPKVTRAEREWEGRGEAEAVKTLPRALRHSRSTSTFDPRQSLNLSPQLLMEVLLRELQAEQ